MYIYEKFEKDDLSVFITIKKSNDDSVIIENQPMISLEHGLYKFNFYSRIPTEQYYYFCTDTINNITYTGVIEAIANVNNSGLTDEEHTKLMSLRNTSLSTLEKKVKLLSALLPTLQGFRK